MKYLENWIWLSEKLYPDNQTTVYSGFLDKSGYNYTVAEFKREYRFDKKIIRAKLRFSADTAFQIFCNNNFIATGPASVGGDFIGNETVYDDYYSFEKEIYPNTNKLNFFARVRMMPIQICEYSKGRGGFMLFGELYFEDGTSTTITTDEDWLSRKNDAYVSPNYYDTRKKCDEFQKSQMVKNIWNTKTAPIPVRDEQIIYPSGAKITLSPHDEANVIMDLPKIYAGFLNVSVKTNGELEVSINCRETDEKTYPWSGIFDKDDEYRDFLLNSAGNFLVNVKNNSDYTSEITVSFITTHYPVYENADTKTDDSGLNDVLDVCKHTLKYCRQMHHLDSPRHCEPLACTGDYYIESLMTPFSFGDMRLAEFDIIRTAKMLTIRDGRMFHTTYSLIWVIMLHDVYMISGSFDLLSQCKEALSLLLKRFRAYIGENGLLENPPDYMFVDWIYIDGISMHHPPKALGQSVLNMFYFGALGYAEKIYTYLKMPNEAKECASDRENLRHAINKNLFDEEKGIYFEGLNTPTDEKLLYQYMPQNVSKRYYLKHSNILASYFSVCDEKTSKNLIKKIMSDEIEGDYQPYFAHYLLEAVYRCGLREKYTLKILERWKLPVKECSKGLVEGFIPPEPTYKFDHSHAWGGTPLYSLPKALMGLEILEPGMKKIKISPSLLGMKYAKTELLTPYGKVACEMHDGEDAKITSPKEISIIRKD